MTEAGQTMTRSQIKMLKSSGINRSFSSPTKKLSLSKSLSMKSPGKKNFLGKSNSKVFLDGVFSKVLKKSLSGTVLFGRPLEEVCIAIDEPPKIIMELLNELMRIGPSTCGIFRKSGSARLVKHWKELLDKGIETLDFEELGVHVVAGLLKEYFRSLPNCLLCSNLYDKWLQIPNVVGDEEKMSYTITLLRQLEKPNFNLLESLMSVLKRIGENSDNNKMTYTNLSVCIGPSILWPLKSDSLVYHKEVTSAVSYLIEMSNVLFSKDHFPSPFENNDSVVKTIEISSSYVPFYRNVSSEQTLIRTSVKRKSENHSKQCLSSSVHLPVSIQPSVSIESKDSGLNVDIDSDADFVGLQSVEFDFIDGTGENKENSGPALKRRKQFNYSKKNYNARYRGFSPSRLRHEERFLRRSLLRKVPKQSKSLVRAASEESILQKLAKDETNFDFLDRQLLTEKEESNLKYKAKYSTTNCSKDSGFTIDDCSVTSSEENFLEVVELAIAMKSLDCHQMEASDCNQTEPSYCNQTELSYCNQTEPSDCNQTEPSDCNQTEPSDCNQTEASDCKQIEASDCKQIEASDCNQMEASDCNQMKASDCQEMISQNCLQNHPLAPRRNSMKKIETFDDVDCKPKGVKTTFLVGVICNNEVEFTDEQLCPLLTDDEEPCIRNDSYLSSKSSFKRNSWMRKRSKTKIKFS